MHRGIGAIITLIGIAGCAAGQESKAFQLNDQAIAASDRGDRTEAESLYRASLDEWQKLGTSFETHYAVTELNLAPIVSVSGRRDEALPLFQHALGVLRRTLGDKNLHTVSALNALGGAYLMTSDYHRAEP